ncbi:MAG: hypothetical protein M3288_02110 [Thermoproteota archaeon]|jgi:hypothetical protein|nr:hypothetical protein [Thermoproteota archaeon]
MVLVCSFDIENFKSLAKLLTQRFIFLSRFHLLICPLLLAKFLSKFVTNFPSKLDNIWRQNDVMIVMVPTMGKTKALVAPSSAPPFAVTKASSPPDAEEPNATPKIATTNTST